MPTTLRDRAALILNSINNFETCLSGADFEMISTEGLRLLAAERSFEIICNALRLLPNGTKARQAEIDWKGMVHLGRRLRRDYHRDNTDALLTIAQKNLPPLKAFAERVIRESQS